MFCPQRGFRLALATYPPRTATALVGLLQALLTEPTILCISMTGCQLNLSSFYPMYPHLKNASFTLMITPVRMLKRSDLSAIELEAAHHWRIRFAGASAALN
jgi:hypothetical protein